MKVERSSLEIPAHIHTNIELEKEMHIPIGKILKAVTCTFNSEILLIIVPLDKIISLSKCEKLDGDFEIIGDFEAIEEIFNSTSTTKIYLDRSLFFQPEYYVLDWHVRMVRLVLLEEIIQSINFNAWVDFTE
ncbi:hypothetical protein [Kurthia zopfii]|uniref:hypothetical protein n=1 Tax=Kurthia zopfii TaxID=1650 RepID=UPI000F70F744|nr:hypothetical protein [Kurthia zopfii]VEI08316.1 Uncharacterised protein [Kurthia zopfii]